MTTTGALLVVGVVCALVMAWSIWLSRGASTYGAEWAYGTLVSWRPMPWILAGVALVFAGVLDPVWIGVAVLYVAAITGFLTRLVRNRMKSVRDTYGGFDDPRSVADEPTPPLG